MNIESVCAYKSDCDTSRNIFALAKRYGKLVVFEILDTGDVINAVVDILEGGGPDIEFRFNIKIEWYLRDEERKKMDSINRILNMDVYNFILELSDLFNEKK